MSFYRTALLLFLILFNTQGFVPSAFSEFITHHNPIWVASSSNSMVTESNHDPITLSSSNEDNENDNKMIELMQELKRELYIMSSITNRGLYSLSVDNDSDDDEDEYSIMEALITQLEAFHPIILDSYKKVSMNDSSEGILKNKADSAMSRQYELLCQGDWDLIMTSSPVHTFSSILGLGKLDLDSILTQTLYNFTQNTPSIFKDITNTLFQSSDLVLSNIMTQGGLYIHPSFIGRVRQCIQPLPDPRHVDVRNEIHIHLPPLIPFQSPVWIDKQRNQGISISTQGVSTSSMRYKSFKIGAGEWTFKPSQVQIIKLVHKPTRRGLKERQKDIVSSPKPLSIPLNSTTFPSIVRFSGIPVQTTYVDDEIRITRDPENHFYVWSRN